MKDNETNKNNPRRGLLKSLAVGGIAANMLPSQWVKPVIDVALLPAHAQMSEGMETEPAVPACEVVCQSGFNVRLEWSAGTPMDVDLEIETPGGTRIAPKAENGVRMGRCGLQHQGDPSDTQTGNETISGNALLAAGRYRIFARKTVPQRFSLFVQANTCGSSTSFGASIGSIIGAFTVGSINLSAGGTASIRLGLST